MTNASTKWIVASGLERSAVVMTILEWLQQAEISLLQGIKRANEVLEMWQRYQESLK